MSNEAPLPTTEERLFSLGDLWLILKRSRKQILIGGLIGLVLTLSYALYQPVVYRVQATFREKGKTRSPMERSSFSFSALLGSFGEGNDSEAVTTLKSRRLLERLVVQNHLQGIIEPRESQLSKAYIQIRDHVKSEIAWWMEYQYPLLQDREDPLYLENITYKGEIPLGYELTVFEKDKFKLRDKHGKEAGFGEFGKPVQLEDIAFTVRRDDKVPLKKEPYYVTLLPLSQSAKILSKQILVETDKNDRTLLMIDYAHRNRHRAVQSVNTLMNIYQDYLKSENERLMNEQIVYLQERQKELEVTLKGMMQEYAHKLSYDFANMGAVNLDQAVEFLAETQRRYRHRLMHIELEMKRLHKALNEDIVHYDSESPGDAEIINRLLAQIRELRHQYDTIDVALSQNYPKKNSELQRDIFTRTHQELQQLRDTIKEVDTVLIALNADSEIVLGAQLQNSAYMLSNWKELLTSAQERIKATKSPSDQEKLLSLQQNLKAYLVNLMHFFRVQENALEESLSHQQHPHAQFQGINLQIAQELYIVYSREANEIDAQIVQLSHILNSINDNSFEVSSLSAVLTDGVSQNLIARGGQLLLSLQDESNRSLKEQERVRDELGQYKRFLRSHIEQTIAIFQLRRKLLQEKITALQNTNLALIRQQISIGEKQLREYVTSRLENLRQEKEIVRNQQKDLQLEMNQLPDHWVAEQLVNQRLEMNREMGREVTNLVESKNIMNNLERIQSEPFDVAIAPIHPSAPRLLILSLVGLMLGLGMTSGGILLISLLSALPATCENLRLAHFSTISLPIVNRRKKRAEKDKAEEKEALRLFIRHSSTLPQIEGQSRVIVWAEGSSHHFAHELILLLAKTGQRVLMVATAFEGEAKSGNSLLSYLEGNTEEVTIEKGSFFDRVPAGGDSDYAAELLGSPRFDRLISTLKASYDILVIVSQAELYSAEVAALLPHAHVAGFVVMGETLQQLDPLMQSGALEKDRMVFLVGT